MYEKPTLQRYGTIRDLTMVGTGPDGDGGLAGIGWFDKNATAPAGGTSPRS